MDNIPKLLKYLTGIDFESEIIAALARELVIKLDQEIMCSLFVSMGWHKIPIKFDPLMADWYGF